MPPGEPAGVHPPWVSRALRHAMAAGRRFCHALVLDMSERRRLEATLFTSRERLRALLDNIPDIAWLKDTEGRYTTVNKAFASAVGKRVEDFAGKKLQDIWPQAVEKRTFYKDDQDVIQSRAPVRTEISVMTSQGERWLTVTRVPVFGAAGEVTGVAGIARDITDEKAATRKIQYMNSVLRAQQQTSPDGILLVDEGRRIVSYNRQFMALFGIDDQLVKAGKDKLLLQSVMGKIAAPEAFLARVRYLYEHREEKSHEEILLTDGRMLERHSAPVTGEGKYYGRVWYFRDITERKRSEETSRQLAAIVQSSRVAIVGKDLQGRITSWNPGAEALYGYSAAEMIGRSVLTLTPDAEKSRVLDLMERVRRGESISNLEMERVGKNGARLQVSVDLSPIRNESGTVVGSSVIVRDISERKRAERMLQSVNRALKVLSACNGALVHAGDEPQLLADICRLIVDLGGYRLAWVGFAEHSPEKTVRVVAKHGHDGTYLEQVNVVWADTERGRGPIGTAIRTGATDIAQNMTEEPRMAPWREAALREGYGSCVALPLTVQGEVIGTLAIYASEALSFGPEEIKLLEELAADLAFGIETLRTRAAHEASASRLQRSMEATVMAMAYTVEKRDPYTAGHQARVAQLAVAIGREMGLPEERLHGIGLGASIHDIGKIYMPAEILNRPGRLNEHEIGLIRTHPTVGYDIVKDIEFPWPIRDMIVQHHERIDGSGYPAGLKGEEIILEARILAVADVVEAMSSHRPYRPALGPARALQEIRLWSGVAYDPAVVVACLRLFEEKRFDFDFSQSPAP